MIDDFDLHSVEPMLSYPEAVAIFIIALGLAFAVGLAMEYITRRK